MPAQGFLAKAIRVRCEGVPQLAALSHFIPAKGTAMLRVDDRRWSVLIHPPCIFLCSYSPYTVRSRCGWEEIENHLYYSLTTVHQPKMGGIVDEGVGQEVSTFGILLHMVQYLPRNDNGLAMLPRSQWISSEGFTAGTNYSS